MKSSTLPKRIFGFKMKSIKLGILIPVLFSLLSNGILKITTIGCTKIREVPARRIHKKYKHLTEFEAGVISLTGPFTHLLLSLILITINTEGFSKIIEINYLLALFSLLPLPGLDGGKIFFYSRPLYLFAVVFLIASVAFIQLTNIIGTLILSIILAFLVILVRMYKTY